MDDRAGAPRLLRGLVTAGLSTLLIAVGHVLGGGALPGLGLLAVLFPLLTAGVVGVADRRRSTVATIATLGGGQCALHVLLALLHPHEAAAGPGAATMVLLHAVATVAVAVLLHHADRALVAVGTALRRVLPRRAVPVGPPPEAPLPPLRAAGPSLLPRRVALAAVPDRRGPPMGC
jgi:hypothetical protein